MSADETSRAAGGRERWAEARPSRWTFADIWPDYRPTRLIELPALARLARS